MCGELLRNAASESGACLMPIDSEHNAIFQCLPLEAQRDVTSGRGIGTTSEEAGVSRIALTASGGPFRQLPTADLMKVSPKDALKHPTWDMGPKITIDSATLFNKGLEMIEARWLFEVEMDRVGLRLGDIMRRPTLEQARDTGRVAWAALLWMDGWIVRRSLVLKLPRSFREVVSLQEQEGSLIIS